MGKKYRSPLDVAIDGYKRKQRAEEEVERLDKALALYLSYLDQEDFRIYVEETTKWDQKKEERKVLALVPQ